MNKDNTAESVRKIKQTFRFYMNGVAAHSMSIKGSTYKIAWGVSLQHLKEIAAEYEKDEELAKALWISEVRECKIIAMILYPIEKFTPETAEKWMTEINTQELAELYVMLLMQYVSFDKQIAFKWLEQEDNLYKICAYNIIGRNFINSKCIPETVAENSDKDNTKEQPKLIAGLTTEQINIYIAHARHSYNDEDRQLRHAVANSLIHLSELHRKYEPIVNEILG